MLPIKSRIRASQFKDIVPKTRSFHGRFLSIACAKIQKSGDFDHINTFAAVVSKNVAKQAVARNRIRRRIYSAVRDIQHASASMVCIIYAKKGIDKAPYQDIKNDILSILQKSRI